MTGKTPGQAAYEANAAIGEPSPTWDALTVHTREHWEAVVDAAIDNAADGPLADRIAELEKTLAGLVAERDELLRERNQALIAQVNGTCCTRGQELAAERGHNADLERQLAETLASYRDENERVRGERDRLRETIATAEEMTGIAIADWKQADEQRAEQHRALLADLKAARIVVAKFAALFGEPDERRMRHASVSAATLDRYRRDAGETFDQTPQPSEPEPDDGESMADVIPDDWAGEAMT